MAWNDKYIGICYHLKCMFKIPIILITYLHILFSSNYYKESLTKAL